MRKQLIVFLTGMLLTAVPASSQTVHDGGGKWTLTSSIIRSGADAAHPNVYQNYLVSSTQTFADLSYCTISHCKVGGFSGNGLVFPGTHTNLSVTDCTFTEGGNATGIYSNGQGTFINCHFDNNRFTNVFEAIHLDFGNGGGSHGDTFDNNYINDYQRIAIELQSVSTSGLKVDNNYCIALPGTTQGGMALSIATGDSTTIPGAKTAGNEIAYNVIIGNSGTAGSGAIENYGSGTNIHDNYVKGPWTWGVIWDWTGLNGIVPWYIANNIFIGCGQLQAVEGFGTAAQNPGAVISGNQSYALNAANAPATPAWSANGPATQPATQPVTQPASFKASAASDGIHLAALPATGGTLTWTASGNTGIAFTQPAAGQTSSVAIPAGQTAYVDQTVPNNWEVIYTFSAAPSVTVLVRAATNQVFTSAVTTTQQPTTQPALTHTLQIFSDGTVSVDGAVAK